MTDKKKIVLIYSIVAAVSVLILGMSFLLANLKKEKKRDGPMAINAGKEEVDEVRKLTADIDLKKDDGASVRLADLSEQVWLAVQFYAACPECAKRNGEHLLKVYQEFQDRENFKVVCFSVDPDDDTAEKLGEIRDALDLQKNWWFVKAEREKLWDFMRNEMLFADIAERTAPAHIAAKGRWAHDLGIQVYRGDTLVKKWHSGLPLDVLRDEVRKAFIEIEKPKS